MHIPEPENDMDKTEIAEKIKAETREQDGRQVLACPDARSLADKLGVAAREVGAVCNDEGIKIVDCALGCFGKKH